MHLKLAVDGTIDDGELARDLGQETADIVILSAADSDLALFSDAHAAMPQGFPSIRLTNLLLLGHPASIDLYIERTLAKAKLVVLRMLGGEAYWPYGVDSISTNATQRSYRFACVPGELSFSRELALRGNAGEDATRLLWRYCSEGGIENASLALQYAAHLIGRHERPAPPRPMPAAGLWREMAPDPARQNAVVIFYRALAASGDTGPVAALCDALVAADMNVRAVYVTSLKDERSLAFLNSITAAHPPDVVVNATAFATARSADQQNALSHLDCPILQVAMAGSSRQSWQASSRGLQPRDLAMHVVLPEVDGRIFAHAIAFKDKAPQSTFGFQPTRLFPVPDRITATAQLARKWSQLRRTPPQDKRVGIILANYPNRDGRLANGVGLDTPASLAEILQALAAEGHDVANTPLSADALMTLLQSGPTNELDDRAQRMPGVAWRTADYKAAFRRLPKSMQTVIEKRWGDPERDPHVSGAAFQLALHRFGNTVVGIQPARGYNIDPKASYHDPDLVPPHYYFAFYLWLREQFDAHAIIHLGKHGNLEWLPGKSAGLSADCFPDAILGPTPNLYPFIVNDPGEGVQAKRRSAAVIVDHLTPPLTRAELHDELSRLESMVDEYALAADLDPKRSDMIADEILSFARATSLDADISITRDTARDDALRLIDAHLCDLKEMQIRDGLHVFGQSPDGRQRDDLINSIARIPRTGSGDQSLSLHRALAQDLGLGDFDPLTRDFARLYGGPRPDALLALSQAVWRTHGDTIERLELLAMRLVSGEQTCDPTWARTAAVIAWIDRKLRPAMTACGPAEMRGLLHGLSGRFVPPGPSGAPTRGRPEVIPTGRNFYAVDIRGVPTPTSWRIGKLAAERLVENYWQEIGDWPVSIALSAWGTSNMRTGGDDIAQVLALIGAEPRWEDGTGRVTGFHITPLSDLGRPRIDVTLRVSGLFRDSFPQQIDLIGSAIRAIAALDEPDAANPIAANVRASRNRLLQAGNSNENATRDAAFRVFGSRPGAYGTGLQALIDEGGWQSRSDIADVYLSWSSFAYGAGQQGKDTRAAFSDLLSQVDLVVQTQDNREHDILDSDDYYQFMGGLAASVERLRGKAPRVAHIDTSRIEDPVVRSLSSEISRVVRGRAANPKWIAGVMRHGYKGAFEIAATVDYLFGFAASTNAVGNHHFDQLFSAYILDEKVRQFMADANPNALAETVSRFAECMRRGLWQPTSNSAGELLTALSRPAQHGNIA